MTMSVKSLNIADWLPLTTYGVATCMLFVASSLVHDMLAELEVF